jgi:uncharacterized protein
MRAIQLSILLILANTTIGQSQNKLEKLSSKPFTLGETAEMYAQTLKEQRVLNIYLPEGYHKDSAQKYPVIYVLDGSADEDFIHIAGLVQFSTFPWVNQLPPSIVVGIANVDRKRDFTYPTTIEKDKKDFPTTGKSNTFITFIETELQPFIAKHYNTDSVKTLIGQSLGGLLATEILLNKPQLFTHYIIVSPSLWWDNESLLKQEIKLGADSTQKKKIYIAVGKEGAIMERDAKALAQKLIALNNTQVKTHFEFFDGQNHANILHVAVYNAFNLLFKKE